MIKPIIQQPSYPTTRGKASSSKQRTDKLADIVAAPSAADENIIPSPESLSDRIKHALASLKKGVIWDRGSIINLNI